MQEQWKDNLHYSDQGDSECAAEPGYGILLVKLPGITSNCNYSFGRLPTVFLCRIH